MNSLTIDEEFERLSPESKAQVLRAMRSYERRCKHELEKFDRFTGSWMTESEEFSQ